MTTTVWMIHEDLDDHRGRYVARQAIEEDGQEPEPTGSLLISDKLEDLRRCMAFMDLQRRSAAAVDVAGAVETWASDLEPGPQAPHGAAGATAAAER